MATKIQLRRGTSAQWADVDPVLASGEPGVDTDLLTLKVGDGVSSWSELEPASSTPTDVAALIAAHAADTTAVHGIADTSLLETTTGSTAKAAAAQAAAISAAAADATSKVAAEAAARATAISNVIASAPGALDTLDELAAALGDDANYAATVTNALALKAPLASPALTGNPTAPTQTPGDNTTKVATTAFTTAAVAAQHTADTSQFLTQTRADIPSPLKLAPTVMASPPTIALTAANAATGIASGTTRALASSGVLATWWRMLAGGTPSLSNVAALTDTVGAATTWLTDPVAGVNVKGTIAIEFMTDATEFEVTLACLTTSAMRYRIWVDGQLTTANLSTAAGTGNAYHRLKVTFSTSTSRLIRLEVGNATVYSVRALPAFSFWKPGDPLGPTVVAVGDSFAEGTGASWFQSWGWEMCHRLNWRNYYQSALGGTGYLAVGSGRIKFRDRVANDVILPNPKYVIVAGGYNDYGGFTAGQIQTEAALFFAAIKAGLPNCKLIVVSPWQSSDTQLTNLRTVRDAIFAAAVGYADLTIDAMSATDGPWITGTGKVAATAGNGNADVYVGGADGTDGTHYTTAGYQYIGAKVAQQIAQAFRP